ncbi:UDP-2,4-diacetamido-2,4,6-trideoxy-beta-L-altropyranose hydrolase, partial [uncultured Clostridium sp.]|uniref:UDP-2,4-diacetamido-2,4, 6-trideoxy-beta-L-altropyranose hydrolase n=1 Tax=uncultured Clostridium sp. TaxID=59620 RepID=UPI0025F76315
MGHVMRCITLARKLRDYQIRVYFVCRNENVKSIIEQNGFEMIVLKDNVNDMNSELLETIQIIHKTNADLFIVDSYFATDFYYINLKKYIKLVVIDGKSECAVEVAAIVNPNISADKELYYNRGIRSTKLLCGINYSFVRTEFITKRKKELNEKVINILLTVGGSDYYKATPILTQKLNNLKNIKIHVIIGPYFKEEMVYKLKNISMIYNNIYIYENILDLSNLMAKMDLIITTGGTTVFEVMALAIPCIVFAIADNQHDAKGLNEYINWFGDIRSSDFKKVDCNRCEKLVEYIKKIIYEYENQKVKIDHIKRDFDGKGVEKIAYTLAVEIFK